MTSRKENVITVRGNGKRSLVQGSVDRGTQATCLTPFFIFQYGLKKILIVLLLFKAVMTLLWNPAGIKKLFTIGCDPVDKLIRFRVDAIAQIFRLKRDGIFYRIFSMDESSLT